MEKWRSDLKQFEHWITMTTTKPATKKIIVTMTVTMMKTMMMANKYFSVYLSFMNQVQVSPIIVI